ncbi:hypothetical protein KY285_030680 [Solanum tuberosum]|nr:hypothetical protein KY284_030502 [Solanum tuberosum]KAH0655798.1 hypothetical protein KY285_030680 [Solanum tuberosum]
MQRVNLWEELYQLHNSSTLPWIISGDFNVVLNENEKIGGVPVQPADTEDFVNCIGSCDLTEVSYRGNPFTWWNGRVAEDCIFERLDRVLVNEELQNWFSQLEVEHLSRTESDHAPMLLTCEESLFEDDPSNVNRAIMQKAQAKFKKYLHYEEEYWKQKAGFTWFEKGDRNTRFFHSLVKGRRKRLMLTKIQNEQGELLEDKGQICDEAVKYYQKQFTQDRDSTDFSLMRHIPRTLTEEDNAALNIMP